MAIPPAQPRKRIVEPLLGPTWRRVESLVPRDLLAQLDAPAGEGDDEWEEDEVRASTCSCGRWDSPKRPTGRVCHPRVRPTPLGRDARREQCDSAPRALLACPGHLWTGDADRAKSCYRRQSLSRRSHVSATATIRACTRRSSAPTSFSLTMVRLARSASHRAMRLTERIRAGDAHPSYQPMATSTHRITFQPIMLVPANQPAGSNAPANLIGGIPRGPGWRAGPAKAPVVLGDDGLPRKRSVTHSISSARVLRPYSHYAVREHRPIGRPKGSKNKPKPPPVPAGEAGAQAEPAPAKKCVAPPLFRDDESCS